MILIIGVDGLLGNFLFEKFRLKSNVIGTSRKRFSNNIILTPYDDIKENIIRGVNYIHLNGIKNKI